MPDERREIVREELPAELEEMMPPVPNDPEVHTCPACSTRFAGDTHMCSSMPIPEPEHLPDEPVVQDDLIETVRPCKQCGESLEGEHPRRQTCKRCQGVLARERTDAHTERIKDEPPKELGFEMPVLVIVEGENPDVTGWVVSIYKLLKHHFGLSKNGVSEVLDQFRRGSARGAVVELYAEMVEALAPLTFADESTKMGLICDALQKCLGKDINLKMRAF